MARPPLAATAVSEPPLPPRFAFVKQAIWSDADPVTHEAFAELVDQLGEAVVEIDHNASLGRALDLHKTVMEVEMAHNLHRDYEKGRDLFSPQLRQLMERARGVMATDYVAALAGSARLNESIDDVFDEFDAILTPAAHGEAPRGDATGSPAFCTAWTYLGTPAVTVPLLRGESGLPIGVQLVGRRGNDAKLLRTARWLVKTLTQ
jgi:Asp-tRNA(Asn)/Glu-tRNA(Gln) amidotransferase A subunit family amidase